MSSISLGGSSAAVLTAATVACAVLVLFLLARAVHRGAAREERSRTASLFRLLAGRLSGTVPAPVLRAAARDAGSDTFWAAVEAITATLRPRERRALARALERSRHLAAERKVLRHDDAPVRRERAALRLGLLPVARSRRLLRHTLANGPEPLRFAAARALAAHHDLAALGWLLTHPETLATRPVRALSGLLRAFGPRGRALQVTALERGGLPLVFEVAVLDALGLARCLSARGAFESRLRAAQVDVRVAAARALGRLGMGEAIPALMLALTDEAWPVRAQSASALGRLHAAPAVDLLARSVTDPAWWVRHHAAYALANLGPEGRDALCELIVRSPDAFAREMAREALDRGSRRGPSAPTLRA